MRIAALVLRICKQFLYDARTLGLIFLAPLLIMALFNQVLAGDAHTVTVATYDVPATVETMLEQTGAEVLSYDVSGIALEALLNGEADVLLDMSKVIPSVTLEGSNPIISDAALSLINITFRQISTDLQPIAIETSYIYGSDDMLLFDYGAPILIPFTSFFFVFITSGVSFLRERSNGTLERLLGTPIRAWELVAGYILGFGIFVSIQSSIIAIFAVEALNAMMTGRLVHLISLTIISSISALALGMLLSLFAQNEFQIMQFIPVVIIPQILFSGLFNLEAFPFWLRFLGHLMPINYSVNAVNDIMIRGKSLTEVLPDISALITFSAAFVLLNIFFLKRHRRI